jgi:acyl-CoA thioesterase FadM
LLKDMTSRQWGMVTNMSSFRIEQYMDSYDRIIGEVFPMDDTNLSESFISLAFKWSKKRKDGSLLQIASGKLSTTWVSVEGYGIVKKAPLPKYFSDYINTLLNKTPLPQINHAEWAKKNRRIHSKMVLVFISDITNRKQYLLDKQVFQTSMEDSNLVGNIYFSNYYSWQARLREKYLFTQWPDIFQQNNKGEFTCVHAEVNHLQEAMPFETIRVSMYLNELFEEGFTLYFEYHSIGGQGQKRKLAHGVHTAIWTSANLQPTTINPKQMPENFIAHFRTMIDKGTRKK